MPLVTDIPSASLVDALPKGLLIDGEFLGPASGETFATVNPATGAVIASVARAGTEDVDRAVAAARRAFEGPWRRAVPLERQRLLERLAELIAKNVDDLAFLDSVDVGLPISRSRGAVQGASNNLLGYAAAARWIRGATIENSVSPDMFTYTRKEPVGVVAAIIPWNSPVNTMIGKIGPALAAGCTVILKPAEQSPLSALRVGRAMCGSRRTSGCR